MGIVSACFKQYAVLIFGKSEAMLRLLREIICKAGEKRSIISIL